MKKYIEISRRYNFVPIDVYIFLLRLSLLLLLPVPCLPRGCRRCCCRRRPLLLLLESLGLAPLGSTVLEPNLEREDFFSLEPREE